MTTFTKERLEQLASGNAWVCVQDDEATELARIALALLESEHEQASEWTNKECLEFLSIAFRHAEIKGDLEMDDIRLGVKMVNGSRAAMQGKAEPVSNRDELQDDTRRLDWLDAQNKRLNEYYGTAYGWKFDANFQRNAMMLNDSNYPVMTVRQAIDEAIAAAPQQDAEQ